MSTQDVKIKLGVDGVQDASGKFEKIQDSVKKLGKEVDKTAGSLSKLEKAEVATAKAAAYLYQFTKNPVATASQGMSSLIKNIGSVGVAATALGGAVVTAGVALFNMTKNAAEAVQQFQNLSYETGISSERLQALEKVSKSYGLNINLGNTIANLNKQLVEGGGDFTKALVNQGIALRDSKGNYKDAITLLDELRAKYVHIQDPARRAAELSKALGPKNRELIALMMNATDGIEAAVAKVEKSGRVYSEETQKNLKSFRDALSSLGDTWDWLKTKMTSGIGAAYEGLTFAITAALNAVRGVKTVTDAQVDLADVKKQLFKPEVLKRYHEEIKKQIAEEFGAAYADSDLGKMRIDEMMLEMRKSVQNSKDINKLKDMLARYAAETANPAENSGLSAGIEAFVERQKLIAQGTKDFLDLRLQILDEQKKFDQMINDKVNLGAGGEEAIAAQAKKLAAMKDKLAQLEAAPKDNPADLAAAQKEADRLAALQKKADEELRKAKLAREASLQSAMTKAQEQEEKERYDRGEINLREYYARRNELAEKQGKAEAAALLHELQKLQSELSELPENSPEATEKQAAIEKAAQALHAKIIQNGTERRALAAEEARETESYQKQVREFEEEIARLQMDRFEQARKEIADRAHNLEELMTKLGRLPHEIAASVSDYVAAASQQVEFAKIEQKAQDAFDEIARARQKINLEVEAGLIFAFEGEQRIMELERERLPLLWQIAEAMRAAAVTPEQIQSAEDFKFSVEKLAVGTDKAAQEMAKFKQNIEGALTSDLTNWFTSGIQGAENMKDAFRGLALSVVQSLQQMVTQMLVTLAVQSMLKAVGGFAGGGQVPVTAASGGMIHGPGTGTSDSIPAWLSNGEYVVRASAVAIPGVKELLDDINYGMRPVSVRRPRTRFAAGGLVDVPSGGGGEKIAGLGATIALDRGLLLKEFKADPEFARLIVGTIGNNKKGVKGALS